MVAVGSAQSVFNRKIPHFLALIISIRKFDMLFRIDLPYVLYVDISKF